MSVNVTVAATLTISEVLAANTGSAPAASRTVTHTSYNIAETATAATTPPVTNQASFLLTLSGGAATIDLRALTGTNGASIDANGLKPQYVRIKNLGANVMTISEGASNGHDLFTADGTKIYPGGFIMFGCADSASDVSGTDKTWDVAGTGSQTAEVTIIVG